MNYGKKVSKMLEHLEANRSAQNVSDLVRACSFGIAQAASMLKDTESIETLLAAVQDATRREAMAAFAEANGVSAADLLKYHFQPGPGEFNG